MRLGHGGRDVQRPQCDGTTGCEEVPLEDEIQDQVLRPLTTQDSAEYTSTVMIKDVGGNHLATGTITWQVKEWSKVRTKK
jgi:hypothetical protein